MYISWWVYFVTGLSYVLQQPLTTGRQISQNELSFLLVSLIHILWDLHFNQCTNRPCFLQCVYISIRDDICTHLPFYTLYVFLHGKIAPNALFCYWVLMMATSSSSSINAIFFTYWVSCQWFDISYWRIRVLSLQGSSVRLKKSVELFAVTRVLKVHSTERRQFMTRWMGKLFYTHSEFYKSAQPKLIIDNNN